jgi:hypothetical protein
MAVTVADVAGELGRTAPEPPDPKFAQWTGWIARAYRLVRDRYDTAYYDALDPERVDDVIVQAVAEHVRAWTPDNVRRKDVSVDDARKSVDYHSPVGPLTIPAHLWATLDPEATADVFSIQMTGTPDVIGDGIYY